MLIHVGGGASSSSSSQNKKKKIKKMWTCVGCSKQFARRTNLAKHAKHCDNTLVGIGEASRALVQCAECDKYFSNRLNLANHHNSEHNIGSGLSNRDTSHMWTIKKLKNQSSLNSLFTYRLVVNNPQEMVNNVLFKSMIYAFF